MLLALDTSTPLVAVALHDGRGVVHRAVSEAPMQHGEQLGMMIDAALRAVDAGRLDLTGVAVGVGPGPFTGLRVGVVTARVLALALDVPVSGVSSLDVLAVAAADAQAASGRAAAPFAVTLDARRKELFWASYDPTGQRLGDLQVTRPDEVPDGLVVGAGPVLYPDAFPQVAGPIAPDAGVLAQVVVDSLAALLPAEPIYLRRPDAQVPGPPKAVS